MLRDKQRRLVIAAIVLFTMFVMYGYWAMYMNKTDYGSTEQFAARGIISLLDPYKVPDDATINCLPLVSAVNKEVICTYPTKDDDYISKVINDNKIWETVIVNNMKKILADDPVGKGLIDLGTNIGVHTITAASMGYPVVGVEPYPPNVKRLAKSLRNNPHLLPKIKIVTNAISNKYQKLHFWDRPRHPGGTKTFSDTERDTRAKDYSQYFTEVKNITVETIIVDDLLSIISFKRAVLKIDIEGYEFKAIQNATRLFAEIDISHVFFEWAGKGGDNNQATFFLNFFKSRNYTAHESERLKPLVMTLEACRKWPFDIVWIKTSKNQASWWG